MPGQWIEIFEGERQRQLYDLYSKEWWTEGRAFEDVIRMVKHSDLAIGFCSDRDELIAFARVLTDYTFKAMIFDVIVSSGFRSKGLGKSIVNRILDHETLTRVHRFELYCPDNLIPFYSGLGFAKGTAKLLFRAR